MRKALRFARSTPSLQEHWHLQNKLFAGVGFELEVLIAFTGQRWVATTRKPYFSLTDGVFDSKARSISWQHYPAIKTQKNSTCPLLAVIHFQVFLLDEQLREITERSQAGPFMETFLTDIAKDSWTSAALHSLVLAI